MKTNFQIELPAETKTCSLRQLLHLWLIPKKWQHFLRIERQVLVNRTYHSFNELVGPGDLIQLDFSFMAAIKQNYLPSPGKLPVIYEDEATIVINKPADIKSHPNRPDEDGTVMNILQNQLVDSPYMVHRLDSKTSGALLVAKTPVVVPIYDRELSLQLMKRNYVAWVENGDNLISDRGEIHLPIGINPNENRKRKIDLVNGLTAWTDYQVIKRTSAGTLLKLSLHTGRTHQLRIHLAAIGHPIINDDLYQNKKCSGPMLLHGYELYYQQPFGNQVRRVNAPWPDYFPR